MKAKLFALLVLFFALTLAAWSYTPGQALEVEEDFANSEWPELPTCSGRDRGDALRGHFAAKGQALTPQENPVETVFVELGCLLASN
jgi:hypothetical protein